MSTSSGILTASTGSMAVIVMSKKTSSRTGSVRTNLLDHIVKPSGKRAAIYVGGIGAKGRMGRAVSLAHLKDRIDHERKRGVSVFFARPVTQKGLELLEKYRFVPVNSGGLGSIYRRTDWGATA